MLEVEYVIPPAKYCDREDELVKTLATDIADALRKAVKQDVGVPKIFTINRPDYIKRCMGAAGPSGRRLLQQTLQAGTNYTTPAGFKIVIGVNSISLKPPALWSKSIKAIKLSQNSDGRIFLCSKEDCSDDATVVTQLLSPVPAPAPAVILSNPSPPPPAKTDDKAANDDDNDRTMLWVVVIIIVVIVLVAAVGICLYTTRRKPAAYCEDPAVQPLMPVKVQQAIPIGHQAMPIGHHAVPIGQPIPMAQAI